MSHCDYKLGFSALALLVSCDTADTAAIDERSGSVFGQACALHADCESDLCATEIPSAGDTRFCIAEDRVIYVDNRASCSPDGDGSRDEPACFLTQAVQLADESRPFVRVSPGQYRPFVVIGKAVGIYGPDPGNGIVEVFEEDVNGSLVEDGADVVIDGLTLGPSSTNGARCTGGARGASLEIRRSQVLSDVNLALRVTGCDFRLDRSLVTGLFGGMQLTDANYRVTNSVFAGTSERSAVVLDGGEGLFALNTVTGNGELGLLSTIQCIAPALLQDSIVAGNVPGQNGSQFEGPCRLRRVVVGSGDPVPGAGAIRQDPELVDFRLPRTPANLACCIDRAPRRRFVRHDFEGTPRPQGNLFDIGADEVELP